MDLSSTLFLVFTRVLGRVSRAQIIIRDEMRRETSKIQWVWDALCDFVAETQCSFSMVASNAFKKLSTKLFYVIDDLVSKLFLHLLFTALTR